MISRMRKRWGVFSGVLLMVGAAWLAGQTKSSSPPEDTAAVSEKVVKYIRERFGVAENVKLTMGPTRETFDPRLYEATITIEDGKQKKEQVVVFSKDGRHLMLSEIFNLAADPKGMALRTISIRNQPSQGPATAPVTIVEYADLQCPMCARLHEFIENDLLPRYVGKVRVVFKDFPLAFHDWSQTGAISSQCAYQIDPGNYAAYRSLIFKNQTSINATNARDMLLNLAAQAGIDSLKLAGCVDSQASRPRVDDDLSEGKKLGVVSTPTSYVNGKLIVGMPSNDAFYNAVDEALRSGKGK